MNAQILSLMVKALQNKHTSAAAFLYAIAKWGAPIASTWFPLHKSQIESTAQVLEGAAVFYGFAAAGDGAKSATKQDVSNLAQSVVTAVKTGDTTPITKSEIPKT
jgi:hypothetical protein